MSVYRRGYRDIFFGYFGQGKVCPVVGVLKRCQEIICCQIEREEVVGVLAANRMGYLESGIGGIDWA